jgi:predicted nucleotidyltransferase
MDQTTVLDNVKKYIAFLGENKFDIRKAYIFGSFAKGNANEDSDIDLAIVLKEMENSFFTQVQFMKMRRNFDLRIEPHPFSETDFTPTNPFVNEILNTGVMVTGEGVIPLATLQRKGDTQVKVVL